MSDIWPSFTKSNPCPICGKGDWCQRGDRAVKCMRVESAHVCDSGGWYHFFSDNSFVRLRTMPKKAPAPPINADSVLRGWSNGQTGGERLDQVSHLAGVLGVSIQSLLDLDATWSPFHTAWGFPMRDGQGNAIGIRLRNYEGQKWAVKGSRSGLFYGQNQSKPDFAFICEGPTDTAAAITLGLCAIGKPSCNACNDIVIEVLKLLKPKRVVIVSDVDSMAQKGIGFIEAQKLQKLMPVKSVVWAPQVKDIREYLKLGGTRALIENDIRNLLWR